MKNTLKKIYDVFITIAAIFSNTILIWILLSTAEIAITNTTSRKASEYNIFTLSNNIKSNTDTTPQKQIYTDIIFDNSEEQDDYEDEKIKSFKL